MQVTYYNDSNFDYKKMFLIKLDENDLEDNRELLKSIYKDFEELNATFKKNNQDIYLYLNDFKIAKVLSPIQHNQQVEKIMFTNDSIKIYI
ncbi:hypothetical protein [Mammaliicoccus vitulinus]|uniref:hypothetical protein n=1 Tax=Mammaliicoccus vitulinus TaxID=71237 RepID=UPI00145B985D|nr:hypothetical protein [Mammaliicoccus vitulinus]QJF24956.1 hypothetical protein HF021_05515 [Mammaliicoccus vitulinus]